MIGYIKIETDNSYALHRKMRLFFRSFNKNNNDSYKINLQSHKGNNLPLSRFYELSLYNRSIFFTLISERSREGIEIPPILCETFLSRDMFSTSQMYILIFSRNTDADPIMRDIIDCRNIITDILRKNFSGYFIRLYHGYYGTPRHLGSHGWY